ncbi:4-hydroxyphenylacetate 3-hydroxylase family protein [Leucobacter soli]|uniref:4-nitrophenol 2-monooxygenase, oxygenase component n=1 Tax=Leucobacter soli TaxID=2812850 RepID=A0A916JTS8_9MICO|nr:4-hydroxyphenylacetate 3-hydroxylase family protein [Leucobacter soli]CAG7600373.1 4-nitrophenol 2-monooxygenase, oxygenase component [Leucobacter soli]
MTDSQPVLPYTGDEYLESLRDGRSVYIYGQNVTDVTTHPAFRNSARMIARMYDALHADDAAERGLVVPTDTGNGGFTHPFFRAPKSAEDLIASRDAIAEWARVSHGWMGRSPDYKATFLGTLGVNHEYYAPFAENARRWYRESQERVLFWNHAIVNPPIDRDLPPDEVGNVAVHAVRETDAGIYLSGAKVVATSAAISNVNFIAYAGPPLKDPRYAVVCAIPMDTPGLKLICRQSYSVAAQAAGTPFDYPLSSRLDENDAILVLDEVFVPWENVFAYGDTEKVSGFLSQSGIDNRIMLQGCTRLAVKLDFLAGVYMKSLKMTGAGEFRGVQARLGEILAIRNLMWSTTESMIRNPDPWLDGHVQPNRLAGTVYSWFAVSQHSRIREIVQEDLGSALIYLPSHAEDFANEELRPYLDQYVRGSRGADSVERVKVLKAMWDATGSEFASRHELYERNYQGTRENARIKILKEMERRGDVERLIGLADEFLAGYDLNGWTSDDLFDGKDVSVVHGLAGTD